LAGALATFFAGFLAATRFLWVVEPLRRRVIAFRPQRGNPPARGSPVVKRFVLASLRGYKRFISPWLGQHCRFHPTCSMYMYEAVQKHGTAKGVWLGTKRVCRCHPLHPGGFDPVP